MLPLRRESTFLKIDNPAGSIARQSATACLAAFGEDLALRLGQRNVAANHGVDGVHHLGLGQASHADDLGDELPQLGLIGSCH